MPSILAKALLYLAAAASSGTALGHTKMGYDVVFPAMKKLGVKDKGAISAKIGWMEVNQGFVLLAIFAVKWAQFGMVDVYDKAFAGLYCVSQLYFGYCYLKAGITEPVIPLWGIPTLVGLSQLV
ncbi:uncharacterized protein L3040_002246 [Drepanopeziza brunnea f. sp. 'multigermtubi']|uniref:uncharacterized protein n=1 Tax=Drepanopeziza brunnea f. sp. 'multigermtubi' TaxID=698441 RepID=UPI002385EE05|nr:hypothetical protein L3040_002246 [Drepanopeziza brunnea f. sp. 'multigermtubi']